MIRQYKSPIDKIIYYMSNYALSYSLIEFLVLTKHQWNFCTL